MMKIIEIIFKRFLLFIATSIMIMTLLLTGCNSAEGTTTTQEVNIPFSIQVTPLHMDDTIVGQSYIFLVTVNYGTQDVKTETTESSLTIDSRLVNISATAENANVTIGPAAIAEGSVAEVVVVPDEETVGSTITVIIKGDWNGVIDTETATLNIRETPSSLEEITIEAVKIRNIFIVWLESNYPNLNIKIDTLWSGTSVYPNTRVIKYYLFFSDEWEIGIRWNTSDESVDWAQMYVRLRTVEFSPSQAFEITSISAANINTYEINPPKAIWR